MNRLICKTVLLVLPASAIIYPIMQSIALLDPTIYVLDSTQFPHFSDQLFYIHLSPRIGEFPIFTVLIFMIKEGAQILEQNYFHPGFYHELDSPFYGDYFQLLVAKLQTNNSISVRIKFNVKANFKHFEIRYGEYTSKEKMMFAKKNYLHLLVLYSRTVQLYVHTQLEVRTLTYDGRYDGVVISEPAYLYCRGSNGYPTYRVSIGDYEQYRTMDSTYEAAENVAKVKAMFQIENHNSWFRCYTQDTQAYGQVKVFHHPTIVTWKPYYYRTFPNGSYVECFAEDGHPEPTVYWEFVRGPPNHDWYFNIHRNQLSMLPNAPIGSEWAFLCIAENVIPNNEKNSTSMMFEFTIVNSNINVLIVVAASAGSVVALVALLVGIILLLWPRIVRKRSAKRASKRNAVQKELAFDPDTVIASSLKLSQSTEFLPDEAPRYEDIDADKKPHSNANNSTDTKDSKNLCYV